MKALVLTLMLLVISSAAVGDSWRSPTPHTYSSSSGNYRLTVYPADLKREQGNLGCEATLEVLQTRRYRQIWRKPLVNDIAPVTALVSDRDGRFVTFDNWLYMGDGDDTIAIYDGRGRLTRKFALADVMSQEELEKLTRSVSSTWWRGDYKLTSTDVEDAERSDELVQIQLVFGQDLTGHGRDLGERTLHIRLRDGQIIEPGIAPPA